MRTGFLLAISALFAACLPAAAQTNAPAAPPAPAEVAESALRDGIPSLAFDEATNALALAETPAVRERAFELAAAARERTVPPDGMLAWLDSFAESWEEPPAADYFRARALASLGRHDEAIALLRPLAARDLPADSPLVAPARRDLAYSLGVSGRVGEALELLERGDPADAPAALDLARLLLSSGDPRRALVFLGPLCAETNAPPEVAAPAALLRALALRDTGAASNALEALEPFCALATNAPALPPDIRALALVSRAVLLRETAGEGAASNALALVERAAGLEGLPPAARLDCGLARLRLRALDAAVPAPDVPAAARALVAAAPDFPAVPDAVREAAAARLAAGDATNAFELADLFVSSFSESPDEASVLRVRAAALAALGRHDEAAVDHLGVAGFASVSGDADGWAAAFLAAASEQFAAGNSRAAAATAAQLLAADPPPPPGVRAAARLLAAQCLASEKDPAAREAFLAVAEDFPDSPERGSALFLAAALVAESAMDADPPDTNALAEAEALFARAGDLDVPGRAAALAALDGLAAKTAAAATNAPSVATEGTAPPPTPAEAGSVAIDPDDEAAAAPLRTASMLGTALVALRGGRFDEALPLLDNAAATPGGGPAAEQAAALRPSVLVALGRPAEAVAAYIVFTNANPASVWLPDVRFWRAAHAFDEGDWPLAADLLAGYAREFPGTDRAEHALHAATVALLRANRLAEVGPAAGALAAAFPSSALLPAARFAHGEALCRLLRFDEAADIFRDLAGADDPELAVRAGVRLGDCLFTLGGDAPARYGESLLAYRTALASPACEPLGLDAECAYKIGRSLEKSGDEAGALDHYYREVMAPYERAPRAVAAPWYSRAAFAAAALLRARGDEAGAAALLGRLARSALPGAEEAARLLSR